MPCRNLCACCQGKIKTGIDNVSDFGGKQINAQRKSRYDYLYNRGWSDGKIYNVDDYNLDVIISADYRVKSKRGTQFRIWATGILTL